MIQTAIFRCKLDGLACADEKELLDLIQRVGAAIQDIHADAQIDPKVEVGVMVGTNAALGGQARADGYMEVKRKDGSVQHFYMPNDGSPDVELTKEQYDAAHATPEMQTQLEHAREVSAKQSKGAH